MLDFVNGAIYVFSVGLTGLMGALFIDVLDRKT